MNKATQLGPLRDPREGFTNQSTKQSIKDYKLSLRNNIEGRLFFIAKMDNIHDTLEYLERIEMRKDPYDIIKGAKMRTLLDMLNIIK